MNGMAKSKTTNNVEKGKMLRRCNAMESIVQRRLQLRCSNEKACIVGRAMYD